MFAVGHVEEITVMTRLSRRDLSYMMRTDAVSPVLADVFFATSHFLKYKIGDDNQIVEVKEDSKMSSMKDVIARETALLFGAAKNGFRCAISLENSRGVWLLLLSYPYEVSFIYGYQARLKEALRWIDMCIF